MNVIKSSKGIVLALVLAFSVLFVIGAILYLTLTTTDLRMAVRSTHASKAFFLAESGIHKALYELRNTPGYFGEGPSAIVGYPNAGEYVVNVADVGLDKQVTSTGYFPNQTGCLAQKSIVAMMSNQMPPGFWGNAIFTGGDVTLGPNSVITGTTLVNQTFPMLNFVTLRATALAQEISSGQKHVYAATDTLSGFPTSFWYSTNVDGIDNDGDGVTDEADENVPNIVYIEKDLTLNGSVGTICGFFVVVGDVLTDPTDSADTTINGNGEIDGCVYTLGDFRINGGGATGLEISGGVWSRDGVILKGKGEIVYSSIYQTSMVPYATAVYSINSWRETH